ncbi:hypothetical protein MRX96_039054 [Rhipicephalus microplus]|uniref:Uncharacterized protein n=1 Tax=Rhipicephalus microplus TaxID=6941 RepID=A0A9J6DSY7_RHIMP|nr:hypothetical protein HPB51_005610 [Rhipicephalus microplus]
MVAHGPSSPCPGLAGTRLQPQCVHYDDDTPVAANCGVVSPTAAPQSANVRSVDNLSDPSEGTYDVFYEGAPNPVPANVGGIRNEVPRRPTEFIWETPPREELVYCANLVASPTTHHAAHAANGPRGVTCNEDVNGHDHDGVDARAAPAVTDLSMTAGSQVTRMSPEETIFFF